MIRPFIGDRCQRFLCRKPLAEILHGFEDARCERFLCREPLAATLQPFEDELGEFKAVRGPFKEPPCEGPARRNLRAERAPSHGEDASLPREVLSTFSSRPQLELPGREARSKASCSWFATPRCLWARLPFPAVARAEREKPPKTPKGY
jgi:hypothetical protein